MFDWLAAEATNTPSLLLVFDFVLCFFSLLSFCSLCRGFKCSKASVVLNTVPYRNPFPLCSDVFWLDFINVFFH